MKNLPCRLILFGTGAQPCTLSMNCLSHRWIDLTATRAAAKGRLGGFGQLMHVMNQPADRIAILRWHPPQLNQTKPYASRH